METKNLTDALLYKIISCVHVKYGIHISIMALPLATKKEKTWIIPYSGGFKRVKIEEVGKVDDKLFLHDSIFNRYVCYCLKEDLDSTVEKLTSKHKLDLANAQDSIDKIKFAVKTYLNKPFLKEVNIINHE